MRTIPVDLILHELVTRLAELPDTHHRDLHLAISRGCIRPQTLAEEWSHGAGVAQQSVWLIRRLDGEDMTAHRLREIAAETRAMEVAVARRLADCALSLLVTQDAEGAATAQTLMQAAQRVVGLATAKPSAEAALFTSATDGADDGLSPATLRRYLAATRDALGLGSGPVFLGDIVTRAKSLADANDARQSQRLKVARDCLPSGVDIIACLRDDKPTTYKASNTGEEYDTPEAAVRAAWEYRQRPTQSVPDRAFEVGDKVRFARIRSGEGYCQAAPPLGWEGEITDIDESNLPIRVSGPRWSDSHVSQGWWFTPADLDLVTPTA